MATDAIQLPIRRNSLFALLAGIALALSLPPWGWWPLVFVGFAVLYRLLENVGWRRRLLLGYLTGLGQFAIGLFWMSEFTLPGSVIAILGFGLFVAAAAVITPSQPGWRRAIAFPSALVLLEALRLHQPLGGTPPGGVQLGQITGLLGAAARVGGPLVLVALAALVGLALAERSWMGRMLPLGLAALVAGIGTVAPAGTPTGRSIDVGLVQGGGRRGFRAIESNPDDVYRAHLLASERLRAPLDLILWPEDVIDIDDPIDISPVGVDLADLAHRFDATVVAGIVEGEGTDQFRNAAVAWSPDGRIIGRYEKVHRVPFGEYVPLRSLVDRVANLSAVPADAIAGHGPNILPTPAGRLGVAISYEVFFADRGRNATRRGAELLVVPTNAASFKTSQMPTQELAAAQLLAVAAGRTVLQAAPTGYSAVITHDGRVRARSVLGRRQVIHASVTLRRGRTVYARAGDTPWLALAALGILTARSRFRNRV